MPVPPVPVELYKMKVRKAFDLLLLFCVDTLARDVFEERFLFQGGLLGPPFHGSIFEGVVVQADWNRANQWVPNTIKIFGVPASDMLAIVSHKSENIHLQHSTDFVGYASHRASSDKNDSHIVSHNLREDLLDELVQDGRDNVHPVPISNVLVVPLVKQPRVSSKDSGTVVAMRYQPPKGYVLAVFTARHRPRS